MSSASNRSRVSSKLWRFKREFNPSEMMKMVRRRPRSGLPVRFTPSVATEIRLANEGSAEATIVEVFTRDRVGVLHAITQALSDLGLDIHLAKISTEGEKVADVFWVTPKIEDPAALARVRDAIATALAEVEHA